MILNNQATEKATFQITSANGRETSVNVDASTEKNVDLTKYQNPFSVKVTISGNTTEMIYDIKDSQSVTANYELSVKVAS